MKTKLVWFWKGFLLSVIAALAFTIANCDNGGSPVKDNGGANEPNTPQESYSLVGKWYEVGSTDAEGRIVVFTDTTVTAWHYANNYVNETGMVGNWEGKWFDNVKYLSDDDTLTLFNHNVPGFDNFLPFKTHLSFFSKDTLFIDYFIFDDTAVPFPYNSGSITLHRRHDYEN